MLLLRLEGQVPLHIMGKWLLLVKILLTYLCIHSLSNICWMPTCYSQK